MPVRVSPISKGAAILIIVIGLVTLVLASDIVGEIAGTAFVVLGVALYWLLYKFARRVTEELDRAAKRVR